MLALSYTSKRTYAGGLQARVVAHSFSRWELNANTADGRLDQLLCVYSEAWACCADAMVVALDGVPLRQWSLIANNTLVWDDANSGSGSIVLQKLQGGPVLFGDISNGGINSAFHNSAGL